MTKKASILLVEDDPSLGYLMKDALEDNYNVKWLVDGQYAKEKFKEGNFDVCLLDIMLPKKDGFSIAEDIRSINQQVPILFVSAKSMEEDRIKGFMKGGDDYITKPFSMDELKLRIEVFLRRSESKPKTEDQIAIGQYVFSPPTFTLSFLGEEQKLTRRESELLQYLAVNHTQVIKREDILNALWGNDDYFNGRSLDVFISKLRKYLSKDPEIKINNYHGVGFQFQIP